MAEPIDVTPELLLREAAWLRRLAATLVVDAARADDLAQQTLLAALERPPRGVFRPRAWLARVAERLAHRSDIADGRRRGRERIAALPEAQPPADEIVARTVQQHRVIGAVLELEEPYRSTLLLRFYEALPPGAIARRQATSAETVRTRVRRGLEALRAKLVERRETPLALIALLDPPLLRAVRRAVAAKAPALTLAGGLGVLGVIGMSTKLKLAAAVLVLAGGTVAVVKLCEEPGSPPHRATDGSRSRAAPLDAASAPPPLQPAESAPATRAPELPEAKAPPAKVGTPPSAPAATCSLEGIVRTATGAPAANAVVLVEDAARAQRLGTLAQLCGNFVELAALEEKHPPGNPARTTTAADGTFRFDELRRCDAWNVAAVRNDDGAALATGVVAAPAPAATRVELTLVEGCVLHGTVADAQGVPIEGALVYVSEYQRMDGGSRTSGLLGTKTARDGTWRTIALPMRGFQVSASARGFLNRSGVVVEPLERERTRAVDFRLDVARTFEGDVVTSDGAPALLARWSGELDVCGSEFDPRVRATTVDSLGQKGTLDRARDRYAMTPTRDGTKFVSIWANDALLGAAEIDASGTETDVVVDLAKLPEPPARGVLRIEAVSADGGAPVEKFHADVTIDPTRARDPNQRVERKGDGVAGVLEFGDLEVGVYEVCLRAPGFAPRFAVGRVSVPTSATRVEFAPADALVTGRVQDQDGRPLAGAEVFLLGADGRVSAPFPECRVVADASGRFAFRDVAAGPCEVVASLEGVAPASAPAVATSGPEKRDAVVLTLRPAVEVEIQPRSLDGAIDGSFMVRVRDERGVPVVDDRRFPGTLTQSGGGVSLRLAPGRYSVEVFCPKYAPATLDFTAAPHGAFVVELAPAAASGRR